MISENIKKLRTEKNMTQKELADKLHVTAQAVSRWETGDVEVSVSTLKEISQIFNVSLNEIVDGKKEDKEVIVEKEYVVQESKPVLAVCEKCNKPIYDGSQIVRKVHNHRGGSTTSIFCKTCDERIKKENYENAVNKGKLQRKRSFLWGGLATALILAIVLFSTISTNSDSGTIITGVIVSLLFFPFLSCLFLQNNFVMEMVEGISSWGFIKLPGLIFSLDLNGIIWLLTVKLAFWAIGLILSIICFILAIIIGLIVSIFVYPFALTKNIKNPELSNEY